MQVVIYNLLLFSKDMLSKLSHLHIQLFSEIILKSSLQYREKPFLFSLVNLLYFVDQEIHLCC